MPTTDPQNELLTQVDENNKIIGPISRGVAHNNPDIFYRCIFVIVRDNEGKILIQKRSPTKDLFPDCWDLSVGGHVNFGISYIETAVRELNEELGISSTKDNLKFLGEVLVTLPLSKEFFHVFEYKLKPTDVIKIEKNEVESTMWMKPDDMHKSMKSKSLKWYERPIQVFQALY